jgi:hypothetical protein
VIALLRAIISLLVSLKADIACLNHKKVNFNHYFFKESM